MIIKFVLLTPSRIQAQSRAINHEIGISWRIFNTLAVWTVNDKHLLFLGCAQLQEVSLACNILFLLPILMSSKGQLISGLIWVS